MAKKRPAPAPIAVGDAFAIPLEGGRYTACRVLRSKPESGTLFVANSAWFGTEIPRADDPALRPVLRLTHHSWKNKACAIWVGDPPPEDFISLGQIHPGPEGKAIKSPDYGAWPFFRIQAQQQWLWDHPEEVAPPPPAPKGRFLLRRFNGNEVYSLKTAVMWAYKTETGVTLWFEVEADSTGAQRGADTAELGMRPKAEVGIELPGFDIAKLVGQTFSIPGAKTDREDSAMALFYYCEHEPLRKNKITVVSRTGDRFRVKWTAVTKDVNYYDGSKPATKVEIAGEFSFKNIEQWSKPRSRRKV